jgi:hypothetical protein
VLNYFVDIGESVDTNTCTDSLALKKTTETITNINNNINMDSTIAGTMNAPNGYKC